MADSRNRCFTFASILLLIFLSNHAAFADTQTFPVTGWAGNQFFSTAYQLTGPSLGVDGHGGSDLSGPYYPGSSSITTSVGTSTDGLGLFNGVGGYASSDITWTFSFVVPSYDSEITVPGKISGTFSVCCKTLGDIPLFTGTFTGTGIIVADLDYDPLAEGFVIVQGLMDFTGTATVQTSTPEPSTLVLLLTGLPLTFCYFYRRRSRVRHA